MAPSENHFLRLERQENRFFDNLQAITEHGTTWKNFKPRNPRGPGPTSCARPEAALTQCDAVLVVDAPAVVQPAASMALGGRRSGGQVVEINPDSTPLQPTVILPCPGKPAWFCQRS